MKINLSVENPVFRYLPVLGLGIITAQTAATLFRVHRVCRSKCSPQLNSISLEGEQMLEE